MMENKTFKIIALASITALLIGFAWKMYDPFSGIAYFLYILGWLSSLLVVGYYSTPSGSVYGKIMFGCVVVMVSGIAMKVLHFIGADQTIIFSLGGLAVTYLFKWLNERKPTRVSE